MKIAKGLSVSGAKIKQIFNLITGDNISRFTDLAKVESETNTKFYFNHTYPVFEKENNERNYGVIYSFVPRGKRASDYYYDDIVL